jgi:hypothetical protein
MDRLMDWNHKSPATLYAETTLGGEGGIRTHRTEARHRYLAE